MRGWTRREFFRQAAAYSGVAAVAPSLRGLTLWSKGARPTIETDTGLVAASGTVGPRAGYGQLVESADCPELRVPEGFRCIRLSEAQRPSNIDPAFSVPPALDGMAAFPLPNGNVRLIRNHEVVDPARMASAFGQKPYDPVAGGGATSLEVAIRGDGVDLDIQLVREFVSLSGTLTNCAGGPTPWGSWLSCEETTEGEPMVRYWNARGGGRQRDHGYIFEVPASAESDVDAVPLRAMGRFVHEAIAVDPVTGFVYETEDAYYDPNNREEQPGAGFYRFIPNTPARLVDGGQLQMLVVDGRPQYDTVSGQTPGQPLPVRWTPIDDPDPTDAAQRRAAVFLEGHAKGGALFSRLEGCWYGDGSIYFNATSGGDRRAGQVWQYRPTSRDAGELTLVFESPGPEVLASPDNICVSPRGGLVLCEDPSGEPYIRGLSPEGEIFDLVFEPRTDSWPMPTEFAGSCFSPDGRVLFFNIQGATRTGGRQPGATYALWGPWESGPL